MISYLKGSLCHHEQGRKVTISSLCMYSSHAANKDFNVRDIVLDFGVGDNRKTGSFQIFDDEINEAREEFEVSLTVLGNITSSYIIQNTTCRIPENDRKCVIYLINTQLCN